MSNSKLNSTIQESFGNRNHLPFQRCNSRAGSATRFGLLFAILVIGVVSIYGGRKYLDSQIPKGSDEFVKETASNPNAPIEEKETGVEILTGIFSGPGPSKEMLELQKTPADEVEFTYDAIDKMTAEELKANIEILSSRLLELRSNLPPSIGGASAGGPPPKTEAKDDAAEKDEKVTVLSLALPLEVMRQIAEQRK